MPYSVSVPITRRTVMGTSLRGAVRLRPVSTSEGHEEQVAIIDDSGAVVGSAPRSVMRRDNLPHIVVAVMVRDPRGRIYVHRRTDTKDVFPGMHDCFAAGCLQAGEEPMVAAAREVEEELGVVGAPLSPLFAERYADAATRHLCYVFGVTWDGPVTHQPTEVAWGAWMTPDELRAHLADPTWPFVPDGRALMDRWLKDLAVL
jgi:8-oxo-dGTP pyrophosphatase MutT (NUDIX family)